MAPCVAAVLCGLGLVVGPSAAGEPDRRLVRLSADGAGGGVSAGISYTVVLAFGQPDAQGPAAGGAFAYSGGVFAALPADRLFRDGFE